MKAVWNGEVIAESDNTIVVENNHYFPSDAIKKEFFVDSDDTSVCQWKGDAKYYHVEVNGERNESAAWYYPEPNEAAKNIAGYVAFWRGVEVVE